MADNKFDPWEEKKIAREAETMLRNALRSKISSLGFKEHVSVRGVKLSDVDAVARTNLGPVGDSDELSSRLKLYLNAISMKMGRHGFIHHYGYGGIRENRKGRTRTIPRTTHYNFKNHVMNITAKDYIDDAINQSQVIPFVLHNLTEIRGKEIFVRLKYFMEK